MELWFIFAVLSAITGGMYIFTTKVAAERDYDVVLISTVSVVCTVFILCVCTLLWSDFSGIDGYMLLLALLNGVLFMGANITRHNAMRCIDTAIYYPLYKTLSPLIVIVASVVFFSEHFTQHEWIGLVVSLMVPLLLISHAEKSRQKDLMKGLRILVLGSIFAALASLVLKEGADTYHNTWLYATVADFMVALVGIGLLYMKRTHKEVREHVRSSLTGEFVLLAIVMSIFQAMTFTSLIFAYSGGSLGIAYTINSLYIIIPIVLSIIYYREHWNIRKFVAIVLSIAALALLK